MISFNISPIIKLIDENSICISMHILFNLTNVWNIQHIIQTHDLASVD